MLIISFITAHSCSSLALIEKLFGLGLAEFIGYCIDAYCI